MNEEERPKLFSLLDTFSDVWSTVNLRQVMSLGFIKLDDIEKLRGCYFTTKEYSSIFVEPITPLEPETESRDISKRHWMLDEDYQGF